MSRQTPRGITGFVTLMLVLMATGCSNATTASAGSDDPASARAMPSGGSSPAHIASAVSGTVRNAGGAPVTNVMVAARSLDEPKNPVPELAVMTDDKGRYVWPATMKPGRYRLSVSTPDGAGSTDVQVSAGVQASADIVVDRVNPLGQG